MLFQRVAVLVSEAKTAFGCPTMSNNLEARPGPKDKKLTKVFVLDTKVSV